MYNDDEVNSYYNDIMMGVCIIWIVLLSIIMYNREGIFIVRIYIINIDFSVYVYMLG